MRKHYVYLDELPATPNWPEVVLGGFYQGHRHNWPLYSRGPIETAQVLTTDMALRVVQEGLGSGYKCHAIPPIRITY